MDTGGFNNPKSGTDSQDSADLQPPGTSRNDRPLIKFTTTNMKPSKNVALTPQGVEQAKKRLRAFSIQKKSSLSPVSVPKPINTGSATVFIGKATGVKTVPKPEPDPTAEPKKPPKPPKPGTKQPIESYIMTQKKTQAEIEDMKRKMELVDLGIPLGLICPPPNSDKAMPTKAMPPIKTFLDKNVRRTPTQVQAKRRPKYIGINSDKVDELIREAKKAREEGKEFKFDYRKLLPDYANPFQRKKDLPEVLEIPKPNEQEHRKSREKDKRSDRTYMMRRQSSHKSDKDKHREEKYKDKSSDRDESHKERVKPRDDSKYKGRDYKHKEKDYKIKSNEHEKKEEVKKELAKDEKEAEVDLKDFVVCDSWSDNEEKSKDSTPKLEEAKRRIQEQGKEITIIPSIDPIEQLRDSLNKNEAPVESTKPKIERLMPVIDSFKFEIEEADDEKILDMFDDNCSLDKYSKVKFKKENYSPDIQIFDYDDTKEETFDGMADDTFLESVINEIKQEDIDETSQDKGLVEYDETPSKDGEARGSVTPEMDDRVRQLHSSRSDYSDGYKSTESGYKSTDSLKIGDYKSEIELERIVEEKKRELERMVEDRKIAKYTADSLETWSFVLKICQPLLFRHDRNKCYKETRTSPKLWFTENPKLCNCVKDRRVVYEELEMCKMELVDCLYNEKQPRESEHSSARTWYPPVSEWGGEAGAGRAGAGDWEAEPPPATPEPSGDLSLDKEYQRFMEAVWPDVAEPKSETPRSTPVRREKKKADDDLESDKKAKKMRTSSEGWSQESDMEEEVDKSYNALQDFLYEALHYNPSSETVVKKVKPEKEKRKRKHSTSTVTDSSESDAKKRKKTQKKKDNKRTKSKDAKRRRVTKKNTKKLKEKQRKKKKVIEIEEDSDLQELEKEKKRKDKKLKKKKQLKQKKKNQKKKKAKAQSSSSSDSSSDSSESEQERKSKKKKKNSVKKNKSKKSYEQEELFDVNILKNIKTERETDEEHLEFSPRRQKPREIINVKELQNDFVGNSIQIKKEVEQDELKKRKENRAVEVGLIEKQEESQESQTETLKDKETPPDFKEQEESQSTPQQSTPQLPPDESNHSQASSQESIYSLKDQPIYEKDESHLRPSSQNSNYSFHDVMASGMYSKNMERENIQLEHETLSREHDVLSQEHETQSRERNMDRHEHDMHSRDHDIRRHDDMPNRDHDIKKLERDIKSSKHDMHRSEHSMSHEHDNQTRIEMQNREHIMQTGEHEIQSHEHEIQGHEHVIQSHEHEIQSHEHEIQSHEHEMQSHEHEMQSHEHEMQSHEHEMDSQEYEHGNYEIYEQMAMAYQSDVASQHTSPPDGSGSRRIETVVRARTTGEIKCDWRAGHSGAPPAPPARPSRWGLKPGEVNIVLTGGEQFPPAPAPAPALALAPALAPAPVYQIQSIANNRTDNSAIGYDEAYMDMYGASDKLQYGDCFSQAAAGAGAAPGAAGGAPGAAPGGAAPEPRASSLDARINLALRTTVLGEVAKNLEETEDKEVPEKGILVTKSLSEARGGKRVTFADGYKPGQDSDVEEPPVRKKKARRRVGCAWPCAASHADHVPLWDALPPPPPPPGSPPPPAPPRAPPPHLLRAARPPPALAPPAHQLAKFDPNSMPAFMPPEPPPGLISFQNM